VWVLGRENRLAEKLFLNDEHVRAAGDTLVLDGERVPLAKGSAVVTRRHPNADDKAIGWIVNSVPAAFDGLGRKLPHYGRYSYLGFEGAEPVNTIKGEWPTTDSPLSADVREEAKAERLPPLALPADKPLIDLPPTFSQKALADHVAWLASPAREGRGIGTNGLQQAAEYIAEHFKATGLTPAGDNGGWFQAVPIERGPGGKPARGVNVIGLLPGTRPELEGQSALVTAHYDHLGRGWPEAHAEDAGQLHPGADDNASGVAVLLELARVFAAGARPPRSIVFVAFTGEEAGLVGARFYAEHPVFPLEKIIGVVNLDTVGRLGTGKILILGAGTATEWPHIFRGAGFVTGIESTIVSQPQPYM
jgi:Zn-dependent M28 family amino/carboxypeptidase